MGYQALLFCPEEKLARVVSQVFSELDFTIEPVHEPFAAVKKLMTQRYDAIVVDCENEQNASLLFKSARNSSSNQSSLAIALVEGQAGVAKAYRIGANLVLTKPINVEQAKGTLRVARGLLRKNSDAASAAATSGLPPQCRQKRRPYPIAIHSNRLVETQQRLLHHQALSNCLNLTLRCRQWQRRQNLCRIFRQKSRRSLRLPLHPHPRHQLPKPRLQALPNRCSRLSNPLLRALLTALPGTIQSRKTHSQLTLQISSPRPYQLKISLPL